jgi:hypothetical protein
MPALSFDRLARELSAAGAAPSVIDRILEELRDHCADAEAAALTQGMGRVAARRQALDSLGGPEAIVAAVRSRPTLLDWRHRWPCPARLVDSIAWWLALPAAPFVYCASHPAGFVRWSLSSSLATCITAVILFALQMMVP